MKLIYIIISAVTVAAAPFRRALGVQDTPTPDAAAPFPYLVDWAAGGPTPPLRKDIATRRRRRSGGGGLAALTEPLVIGLANPLTTGVGEGVAGAAGGTQQTADLLGDAIAELFHVAGGLAAHTEQGAGTAVANAAPVVQGTVEAVQHNHGALGDVATILGGRS